MTVGGQHTVLDDYELTDANTQTRIGLLSGVSRRVDGHQVGFVAECWATDVTDDDFSGCVAILSSWQWGSGAS